MFLKRNVLKKIMKDSYKRSGLHVSKDDGPSRPGYTVSGYGWAVWVDEALMTKEFKADIVELAGELPDPGTQFCASTAEDGLQMEVYIERERWMQEWWNKKGDRAHITRLVIAPQGRRIVQTNSGSGFISQIFVDLLAPDQIDQKKGETVPDGPYETEQGILIGNNACFLFVQMWRDEELSRFWEEVDRMDIDELMRPE